MTTATRGIVLRRFDYSETSQVIHLLTREHGRVSVIGRGIKRPNAALKGPADLFCEAIVAVRARAGASLGLLTRYEPVEAFLGLRRRLDRIYAAFYLTELVAAGTRENDPDIQVYSVVADALGALAGADAGAVPAITAWAELGWARSAGFAPSLDRCVACDRPAPPMAPAVFRATEGGIVCRDCRGGDPRGVPLTAALRRSLAALQSCPPEAAATIRFAKSERLGIRRVLYGLVHFVIERPIASLPFCVDPRCGYSRDIARRPAREFVDHPG